MSKKKFRVGQKVQSVFDPTHTFVIDKSRVPERIYHEKGSDRWWTRNELQRLGAPENPISSTRLNGKGQMHRTRSNAFPTLPGKPHIVSEVSTALGLRKCLLRECDVRFRPKRPWQKFHAEGCRLVYWKRRVSPESGAEQTLQTVQ
ncbi:MAG TPA: hypothetical protein VNY24_00510 [Candidatus Acidoferrales bacterium]|jgi:hypothetical protein|nr:hypothetical protein [Candidatus Acidoferrales bacterium]